MMIRRVATDDKLTESNLPGHACVILLILAYSSQPCTITRLDLISLMPELLPRLSKKHLHHVNVISAPQQVVQAQQAL